MLYHIQEIIKNRYLISELVVKELKVRYSRPLLGFIWFFLSPLLTVLVLHLIFSLILKVRIEEAPFFLYLLSAVIPWRLFQDSVISSSTSLVDNKNLIKESNFPHFLIPVSLVFANLINFLPSLIILIIISFLTLKGLPVFIIFLPIVLLTHLIMIIGLSIVFSIFYVKWRDIKYLLEIILLLLFYLSPAFYSISLVRASFPPGLFKIYILNPFVCILILYRCVTMKNFFHYIQEEIGILPLIVSSLVFAVSFLFLGFSCYLKNKNKLNDHLAY